MKRFLVLLIAAVLAVSGFAACSSGSSQAPAASAAPSYDAAPQESAGLEEYGDNFASESAIPLPLLTPSNAGGKKIIYTATLWLQTKNFDEGTRRLINTVTDMGGYLQSAYINGRDLRNPDVERSASYTLRIPSENLAEFLVVMEENYTLWKLEQESEDITAKRRQTETRLDDLRDQEMRLIEAIGNTEDAKEKLSLERQLADVQTSISSLDASQVSTDNDVIYSTVTVQLYEVIIEEIIEEPELSFGEKLVRTIVNTLSGFISFGQGLILFAITVLPVLAVAVVIFIWGRRFIRKHEKAVHKALGKSEQGENQKQAKQDLNKDGQE